jgi:chlorite dismutase
MTDANERLDAETSRRDVSTAASVDQPTRRQVVKFSFFRVDPAWRALPAAAREAHKQALNAVVEAFLDRLQIKAYSVVGMRGDADFLLWQIGETLEDIQALHTAVFSTPMAPYLSMPYSYLAMTRRSVYLSGDEARERTAIHPAESKYFFVYPFVKTRPWYQLSLEERQEMMDEHIRVGRKYPSVKLNTTYSFGLDDQEFVVSFETDEPAGFLDLVMELREAKSSLYTLSDTPIFTCISMTLRQALDALGGVGAGEEAALGGVAPVETSRRDVSTSDGARTLVASLDELPEGGSKVVYHGGRQVALFNAGGRIYALANRCSHANGPLSDGELTATGDGRPAVTCPYHASRFDLQTGEPLCGPAARPVVAYDVTAEGGRIYLSERVSERERA